MSKVRHLDEAIRRLVALGGEAVPLDLSPFLEAARLLYDGPWVAERYSVAGALMESRPEAVLPVIRAVLAKAPAVDGCRPFARDTVRGALKVLCDKALENLDCVSTPFDPRPVTLAELGRRAGVAQFSVGLLHQFHEPAGLRRRRGAQRILLSHGLPWGVTLFGRVFTDQYLLSLADALQRQSDLPLIGAR